MEKEISDQQIEELLGQLAQCTEACIQGAIHCLKEGGEHAELSHVRILLDCTEICQAAESFFLRESDYGGDILEICADICEDCAESCGKFPEDKVMKSCESICRNAAEACDEITLEEEEEETVA